VPTPPRSDADVQRVVKRWNEGLHALNLSEAADKLKISRWTLRRFLAEAQERGLTVHPATNIQTIAYRREVEVPELPDDDLPVEEIVEQRKREFAQKKKHEDAARLIPIKVKIPGPIGILHFGDPHVDDDGTDIATLEQHSDLTHQEGIFGANVGDTTNNWIGRLARLYADQNMGRKRALKLAEWFIGRTRWLYMIAGNHDAWSGQDDPIRWIARQQNILYRSSEARLQLNFQVGDYIRVNARHDFAGGSQWNPTHGPMKAAQLGVRDDLLTCGHKHKSGYGVLKDPETGRTIHAIQVGSYKLFDRYAKDKGFRDQSLGPACLTTISPLLPADHPDRVKVFWDPNEGADYLKFLRRKK
jgi:hypothetical protein